MITINEIKQGFIRRIDNALFIDCLRETERDMFGFFSNKQITEMTKEKRKQLENNAKMRLNRNDLCFDRSSLEGVYENRTKYEAVVRLENKILSLGLYKTAEKAHDVYLKEIKKHETKK